MSHIKEKPDSVQLSEIVSRLFINCQEKEGQCAANYGLSTSEFRCVRILHDHEKLTVNNLAQKMSLTSSRVTRIVDGLVKKELANRVSGESDRRIYNLSLTVKGKELASELVKNYLKIHEEILNNIQPEHHQILIEILEQLNDAMEKCLKSNAKP